MHFQSTTRKPAHSLKLGRSLAQHWKLLSVLACQKAMTGAHDPYRAIARHVDDHLALEPERRCQPQMSVQEAICVFHSNDVNVCHDCFLGDTGME
jgi:hypothetical protein